VATGFGNTAEISGPDGARQAQLLRLGRRSTNRM
jgi:hypothetical protein